MLHAVVAELECSGVVAEETRGVLAPLALREHSRAMREMHCPSAASV